MILRNYLLIFLILIARETAPFNYGTSTIPKPMISTMAEVIAFIEKDPTDSKKYSDDFVCWNFGCDLIRNAHAQGIDAKLAAIEFDAPPGHAVVAFETSDFGTVYVEPQNDHVYFSTMKILPGIKNVFFAQCPDYWLGLGGNTND